VIPDLAGFRLGSNGAAVARASRSGREQTGYDVLLWIEKQVAADESWIAQRS